MILLITKNGKDFKKLWDTENKNTNEENIISPYIGFLEEMTFNMTKNK